MQGAPRSGSELNKDNKISKLELIQNELSGAKRALLEYLKEIGFKTREGTSAEESVENLLDAFRGVLAVGMQPSKARVEEITRRNFIKQSTSVAAGSIGGASTGSVVGLLLSLSSGKTNLSSGGAVLGGLLGGIAGNAIYRSKFEEGMTPSAQDIVNEVTERIGDVESILRFVKDNCGADLNTGQLGLVMKSVIDIMLLEGRIRKLNQQ